MSVAGKERAQHREHRTERRPVITQSGELFWIADYSEGRAARRGYSMSEGENILGLFTGDPGSKCGCG